MDSNKINGVLRYNLLNNGSGGGELCMGLYFRKRKSEKFNRHHLLYPARAWREAGDDAQFIRGSFIVSMPSSMHEKLHKQVDKRLGGRITRNHLPPPEQLAKMAESIRNNSDAFHSMTAIEKLRWLRVQTADCGNRYTKALIGVQIAFLRKHEGEY